MPFVGGTRTFLENMAQRLVADGHHVTVLTTNARQASDFWQRPPSTPPGLSGIEVLDGVAVERLALHYPWPAPYRFGLLRRAGLWLQLSGLPADVTRPIQRFVSRWMPPLRGLPESLERLALGYPWPAPYRFGLLRRAGLWVQLSGLPAALTRPIQRFLSRWMPPLHGLPESLQRLVPKADLVHADESSWDGLFVAAASAADRHAKPLVVRPLMHLGSAWVQAHYQMAHQVDVYRAAAIVLALSQAEAAAYSSLGVPTSRLRNIHMGIEPDAAPSLEGAGIQRLERELAVHGPVVAFVGANTYDKGAFTLAEAVIQLVQEGMPLTLICAGPEEQALSAFLRRQSTTRQAIVRDHVRILGVVSEVTKHRLLAICDLLALPSQVDTFGIVLLEAWQHRKPVIGARAGGIPDVIKHEENGLLVPFGDVEALAAAIRRLLENHDWAAQLGQSGYNGLGQYTWDRTYATLLEAYRLAVTGGS